jgi:hypothetical protein
LLLFLLYRSFASSACVLSLLIARPWFGKIMMFAVLYSTQHVMAAARNAPPLSLKSLTKLDAAHLDRFHSSVGVKAYSPRQQAASPTLPRQVSLAASAAASPSPTRRKRSPFATRLSEPMTAASPEPTGHEASERAAEGRAGWVAYRRQETLHRLCNRERHASVVAQLQADVEDREMAECSFTPAICVHTPRRARPAAAADVGSEPGGETWAQYDRRGMVERLTDRQRHLDAMQKLRDDDRNRLAAKCTFRPALCTATLNGTHAMPKRGRAKRANTPRAVGFHSPKEARRQQGDKHFMKASSKPRAATPPAAQKPLKLTSKAAAMCRPHNARAEWEQARKEKLAAARAALAARETDAYRRRDGEHQFQHETLVAEMGDRRLSIYDRSSMTALAMKDDSLRRIATRVDHQQRDMRRGLAPPDDDCSIGGTPQLLKPATTAAWWADKVSSDGAYRNNAAVNALM